ncbi:PKD domain-containing protein [Solirubrobacter soli]|uniref:PKD domain-containing protein n=1 Tax=Solirubrobacter soli TaxID=363832 RepID=UPI000A00D014|nr:PKD domain-containing protein [Solirubrobacter soli]
MLRHLLAAGVAALILPTATASAQSFDIHASSQWMKLGGYTVSGGDDQNLAKLNVTVTAEAQWTADLKTMVGWNSDQVRQGGELYITRSVPLPSGQLQVVWTIKGSTTPGGTFSTKTVKTTATCIPKLLDGAAPYRCTVTAPNVTLAQTVGLPGSTYINFQPRARFTIQPRSADITRELTLDGGTGTKNLSLSQLPQSDYDYLSCSGSPAQMVTYELGHFQYYPDVKVEQQPLVQVGKMDPVMGLVETDALINGVFGPKYVSDPFFVLLGGGKTMNLGLLKPNLTPPDIHPLPVFTGDAGSTIYFEGYASSPCALDLTYRWDFGDGETSSTQFPHHVYATPGIHGGTLTVKDPSGLKSTRSFSVFVK